MSTDLLSWLSEPWQVTLTLLLAFLFNLLSQPIHLDGCHVLVDSKLSYTFSVFDWQTVPYAKFKDLMRYYTLTLLHTSLHSNLFCCVCQNSGLSWWFECLWDALPDMRISAEGCGWLAADSTHICNDLFAYWGFEGLRDDLEDTSLESLMFRNKPLWPSPKNWIYNEITSHRGELYLLSRRLMENMSYSAFYLRVRRLNANACWLFRYLFKKYFIM